MMKAQFKIFRQVGKISLRSCLFLLILFSSDLSAQKPPLAWAVPLGTNVLSQDNALDAQGNVYITGSGSDTVDFDPGPATHSIVLKGNSFLAKYRTNGQLVWARSLGFDLLSPAICTDNSGQVYLAGTFTFSVDVGPGPPVQTFTANNQDVLILRLDSMGACKWAGSIGSDSYDWAVHMKCDPHDNLYLGGNCGNDNTSTPMDLDPGPGVSKDTIQRYSDGYIIKLDPGGNYIWGGLLRGRAHDQVTGFDLDGDGNLILAGTGAIGMDLDPGPAVVAGPAPNDFTYLSRFSSSGKLLWTKFWMQTYTDARVKFDQSGNMVMLSSYYGTVDVDPGPQTHTLSSWKYTDAFLVKLDSVGQYLWSRNWHDSGYIYTGNIETDINNNIYATAMGGDRMAIDASDTLHGLNSFVVTLDQNGNHQWHIKYKMGSTISRPDVKVTGTGEIYISVWYYEVEDLDPGNGILLEGVLTRHSSALIKLHPFATVGVHEYGTQSSTIVYPNPTHGEINIRHKDCNTTGYLILRDAYGRVVSRINDLRACTSVSTGLPAGVYFCSWSAGGHTFKLVVTD